MSVAELQANKTSFGFLKKSFSSARNISQQNEKKKKIRK
jgi:hypothetical protein